MPAEIKKLLTLEILRYPSLIRRELLSNVLAYPDQLPEIINFIKNMVARELGERAAIEINLLEGLKLNRFSMAEINRLATDAH